MRWVGEDLSKNNFNFFFQRDLANQIYKPAGILACFAFFVQTVGQ